MEYQQRIRHWQGAVDRDVVLDLVENLEGLFLVEELENDRVRIDIKLSILNRRMREFRAGNQKVCVAMLFIRQIRDGDLAVSEGAVEAKVEVAAVAAPARRILALVEGCHA